MNIMNVIWIDTVCKYMRPLRSAPIWFHSFNLSRVNVLKEEGNNSTAIVCWLFIHSLIFAGFRSSASLLWPVCCTELHPQNPLTKPTRVHKINAD